MCMHQILMEDDRKLSIKHQRRLNLSIQEVVKKEILKLLKADIVYPIFDSMLVSPIQIIPKKEGMTLSKMRIMS